MLALLAGLPLVGYGIHRQFASGWDPSYTFFLGGQFNYWGSLLVSFGWLGAVYWLGEATSWGQRDSPTGCGREDRFQQLHPSNTDLYDDFLRAWVGTLRLHRSSGSDLDRHGRVVGPTGGLDAVAASISLRSAGVALA